MQKGSRTHIYEGKPVALATKHGKERQIARPLRVAVGLQVYVPEGIDTDTLGTFTGEIPRPGTPDQVVLQKARLGMQIGGSALGLANEGSFGPHPQIPFLLADTELLVFVDDERGFSVQEVFVSEQTNAAQCCVTSVDEARDFLERVHFPSHGLIVRPNALQTGPILKGITALDRLSEVIEQCIADSPDGLARIETDLRAHMNPMRRRVIRHLAARLGRRLACCCPRCETPGWGRIDGVRGLPCEWCGSATDLLSEEVYGCPLCPYQERRLRADGLRQAPAAHCPHCNP